MKKDDIKYTVTAYSAPFEINVPAELLQDHTPFSYWKAVNHDPVVEEDEDKYEPDGNIYEFMYCIIRQLNIVKKAIDSPSLEVQVVGEDILDTVIDMLKNEFGYEEKEDKEKNKFGTFIDDIVKTEDEKDKKEE